MVKYLWKFPRNFKNIEKRRDGADDE